MQYRTSLVIASATTLVAASLASAAVYSTPFSPGTSRTLVTSFGTTTVGTTPTWIRANGSASEINATAPTTISTNTVNYGTNTFTVPTTGLYELYSAQSADGYMHLYANSFNPTSQLTNIVAGDDDMGTLNGGNVPNRNGVTGSSDSGFSTTLTAGVNYTMVTSRYSGTTAFDYYNEVYTPGTPASPTYTITDNSPTSNTAVIDLLISDPGTIQSVNSVTLTNLLHTWAGDILATLTHVESGKTVDLIDRVQRDNVNSFAGLSSDLVGDYTLSDGGPAWPSSVGAPPTITPGSYGLFPNTSPTGGVSTENNPLSYFVGDSIAGTWRLRLTDNAGGDTGTISAFSLNVNIPEPTTLGALAAISLLALRRRA